AVALLPIILYLPANAQTPAALPCRGCAAPLAITTTTLTSPTNPAVYGQNVTLVASVAPASATGKVQFKDGTTTLGTPALSGGSATVATPYLSVGTHS